MKVPLSWLREYVDFDEDYSVLADGLTSLGLKVEGVDRPGESIEKVVVGKVLEIKDHPRADQLILVDVDVGSESLHIVCGARNFAVGDLVPVALVGASLPDGRIERATKRGEVSEGMLCSPRELRVSEDHSGILVLPSDSEVGADVRPILGLDDVVLDLEITPNRPDAMSLLGVAREVVALTQTEWRVPDPSLPVATEPITGLAAVEVEDAKGCPRYLARVLTGITDAPSPAWVQRRLHLAGVRPISSIVDATNYAMLVAGHPMHAFDLDRLDGNRIVVRRARRGERLVMIDGDEHELDPDDLLICDASRPVALAGIMGGSESEVSPETTRVLLESAYFDPKSIFRSSKRHGLRSESSARFERGADPNAADFASRYASRLMIEWANASVAEGTIDIYPKPVEPWIVSARPPRVNLVLGTSMSNDDMVDALARFQFEPTTSNGNLQVRVPTFRRDVTAEEDLIEEIGRLLGYEKIPGTLPSGANRAGYLSPEQKAIRRLRDSLVGAGLYEAESSSLISPADIERVGYPEGHEARKALRMANPLSSEASLLRPSLLPGLLSAVARNVARRNLSVRLFEIGHCFLASGEVLPREPLRLGIAMHGQVEPTWLSPERELDFYDLKGVVELLIQNRIDEAIFQPSDEAIFHPGRSASVLLDGQLLGSFGELHTRAQERFGLPNRVLVAELDVTALLEAARWPGLRNVPKFPAVLRDLAVSVPESVPVGEVVSAAREAAGDVLEELRIFDLYRGEQAGEGRKSVAMSLKFRLEDRTLTDEEAQAIVERVASRIAELYGGQIRK
jgi:phenylalanyl-tRNA synthetase beta chain